MSPAPLTLAPLVLAFVLLLSAASKWRDRDATLSSIVLLRMPRVLHARWVTVALPVGEIVLALAMLTPSRILTQVAAVVALGLFLVYLLVVARAMTFDPRPSCGCFGRIGDQRVNARTVARNVLFVLLAVLFSLWAFAGNTVPAALADFTSTDLLWLVVVVLIAAVAVFISGGSLGAALPRRQHSTPAPPQPVDPSAGGPMASGHSTGAPVPLPGEGGDDDDEYLRVPIPEVLLLSPQGAPTTLHELATERAQLLVFGNCYCGTTIAALRESKQWAERLPALDVRVIWSGVDPAPDVEQDDIPGWRDHASVTWRALALPSSPAAVLLGADGLLAGGPVGGYQDVSEFVEDIVATLAEAAPIEYPLAAADQTVVGQVL